VAKQGGCAALHHCGGPPARCSAPGRPDRHKRKAASFLEDEEEDDFEAVAGAAEESLMADGSYLHASALDEPFGHQQQQQQQQRSQPQQAPMHGGGAGGDGMAAILRLGQSAVGATVHLQWLQHGSATYAARIGAVNPNTGQVEVHYENARRDTLELQDENRTFTIRLQMRT